MISSLKNNKKKVMLTASIAVILIAALVVVMTLTKPYAVYADGTKVENPYAVKAGDKELFLVKDSKTAEKVIETVMDKYSPEGAQINSITVDKKLSSEEANLKRGGEPETVEADAVDVMPMPEVVGGSVPLGEFLTFDDIFSQREKLQNVLDDLKNDANFQGKKIRFVLELAYD